MANWTLAIGGSDHDASAALICGNDVRVAIEQERLSRRKHGASFWFENYVQRAVDYCLAAEGITMHDVANVVASDTLPARVKHDLRENSLHEFDHHLCHAASAYMMLPLGSKAGVVVYDGFGSSCGPAPGDLLRRLRQTFSFFTFDETGYECIGTTCGLGFHETEEFPIGVTDSIGMLYEMVTAALGYELMDSGKTMGLSSHGRPRFLDTFERFVSFSNETSECFRCSTDDPEMLHSIDKILRDGKDGFSVRADLAASLQSIMNRALLNCEQFFHGRNIEYLCVSGGCALNTVANAFLVEHSSLGIPILIPPHCGDAGLGLGGAWLHEFHLKRRAPSFTFRGGSLCPGLARPGRSYEPDESRSAVQEFYPRLVLDASVDTPRRLARLLAQGEVIAIFNGRSEIGPRALGGRSIFADPRSVSSRERINRQIKCREPYRPLAPMVLDFNYERYFVDGRMADPFMLKVARVRDMCRQEAPAVVHVDGTARVQIIPSDGDPFLVEMLRAFEAETGVGILINTSFNRRGEPIVETPLDAVDAFLGMSLDGLYLDGAFYRAVAGNKPVA